MVRSIEEGGDRVLAPPEKSEKVEKVMLLDFWPKQFN